MWVISTSTVTLYHTRNCQGVYNSKRQKLRATLPLIPRTIPMRCPFQRFLHGYFLRAHSQNEPYCFVSFKISQAINTIACSHSSRSSSESFSVIQFYPKCNWDIFNHKAGCERKKLRHRPSRIHPAERSASPGCSNAPNCPRTGVLPLRSAPFFEFFLCAPGPDPFIKRTAPPYTSLEACGGLQYS